MNHEDAPGRDVLPGARQHGRLVAAPETAFLAMRTVEAHRSRVQQELNRFSRAQLVRYALDHGLLTGGPAPG